MDEFLTKTEVAKLLKVSESTIDRWRKEGMPSIKVQRKVLFKQDDVEKWLQEKSK
jgi:excisionase family DNA binding protein